MSDSLAQKVAEFQRQRILNRTGMGSVSVVLAESDSDADADRIIVNAERRYESPENSGIFRFTVTNTIKVRTLAADVIDQWLAEVDATQTAWVPGAPTAGYVAALAALNDLTICNEQDSDRESSDKVKRLSRTFEVLAS